MRLQKLLRRKHKLMRLSVALAVQRGARTSLRLRAKRLRLPIRKHKLKCLRVFQTIQMAAMSRATLRVMSKSSVILLLVRQNMIATQAAD